MASSTLLGRPSLFRQGVGLARRALPLATQGAKRFHPLTTIFGLNLSKKCVQPVYFSFLRKEVIQPQVPLRLPCYDFAPVTDLTLDSCLLAVSPLASGPPSFHGVTGGVYKARERIHRGVADPRLLAIPASCSRVTDCNPNLDWLLAISSLSRVGDALYQPL